MPLPIVWRAEARADQRELIGYIAARNPEAAARLNARIERLVEGLALHPHMFRPGRVAGTREAVAHPNYVIVYRVDADAIRVLRVLHARRRYP